MCYYHYNDRHDGKHDDNNSNKNKTESSNHSSFGSKTSNNNKHKKDLLLWHLDPLGSSLGPLAEVVRLAAAVRRPGLPRLATLGLPRLVFEGGGIVEILVLIRGPCAGHHHVNVYTYTYIYMYMCMYMYIAAIVPRILIHMAMEDLDHQ